MDAPQDIRHRDDIDAVRLPEKPATSRGVWFVNADQEPLCGYCRHVHHASLGGSQCMADPLRLAVARACALFEFVPGVEELWD